MTRRGTIAAVLCAVAVFLAGVGPLTLTGCATAPNARVAQVQTLKSIGAARDAAMKIAAGLLQDKRITWEQWRAIADFHDLRLQPAYRLAVVAARSDLSSVASPDLVALFQELFTMISALQQPTT